MKKRLSLGSWIALAVIVSLWVAFFVGYKGYSGLDCDIRFALEQQYFKDHERDLLSNATFTVEELALTLEEVCE